MHFLRIQEGMVENAMTRSIFPQFNLLFFYNIPLKMRQVPKNKQNKLTSRQRTTFRNTILTYYRQHPRRLPWRETDDPYRITVSELMLQQTQVDRVLSKYGEFVEAFPNFSALAEAPLQDVLLVWQGLGYNRRAKALKDIAILVMTDYDGILPSEPEELETFPGIGPATAREIAAFAFNKPVVFIETNIRSLFIHFFFPDAANIPDRSILPLIEATLVRDNPREWYYALMDYGSMLKRNVPNPGRKSAHYARQSRFEGSDRQIRGAIIRLLTSEDTVPENTIIAKTGCDPDRGEKIMNTLVAEGLVQRENGLVFIP